MTCHCDDPNVMLDVPARKQKSGSPQGVQTLRCGKCRTTWQKYSPQPE